jgi:hypothetical protein
VRWIEKAHGGALDRAGFNTSAGEVVALIEKVAQRYAADNTRIPSSTAWTRCSCPPLHPLSSQERVHEPPIGKALAKLLIASRSTPTEQLCGEMRTEIIRFAAIVTQQTRSKPDREVSIRGGAANAGGS